MAFFKDTLKAIFFGTGTKSIAADSNVCLLDAAGEPIGCDTIDRVAALALNPNDFVDMGLPSGRLWEKRNLGALKETDYGWYFSWGNLNGHSEGSGYDFSQAKYDTTSAASISTDLTLAQDAARSNLGKAWRLPTSAEFAELFNSSYTTNEWTTINGVNGRLVTSKANRNTLFFPAAGYYGGTSLNVRGSYGYYWGSSWVSSTGARDFVFSRSYANQQSSDERRFGLSVRAVQ